MFTFIKVVTIQSHEELLTVETAKDLTLESDDPRCLRQSGNTLPVQLTSLALLQIRICSAVVLNLNISGI